MALDTFPYSGTTTTCELLWMGVPTITLAGQTHVTRVSASLMRAAGLPQFVAESEDEFVRRAIAVASDLDALAELRRTMRDRVRASPLMNGQLIARRIEEAYRQMWRTWCSSTPR